MLRIIFTTLMLVTFASGASAQNQTVKATIEAQIAALQADDFEAAFAYASPTIKGVFGTSENFGVMVRRGYPMVWRPDEIRFLEQREIAGQLWQKVMIRDAAGAVHILDYQMIPSEGGWQINAVQLLQAPGESA